MSCEQNKHKEDCFLVVGKSCHVYLYDDFLIEKYLLEPHSRSPPSLPKEVKVQDVQLRHSQDTLHQLCHLIFTLKRGPHCSCDETEIRYWTINNAGFLKRTRTICFVELFNKTKIPFVGLGTWQSEPGLVGNDIAAAIKMGYQHIDCAQIYGKEEVCLDYHCDTRMVHNMN
ncbi:hypothetical protein L1987_13263 [Smallanthus sonchifolius]|uniref:Uncharacterized protein n=1 Tax=Smallanthus sonchifolius TaxID=185202 RepID=A0ACB9JFZ6_9ASTR|nr:hypothetical protein L1987_13263 [Smallanthus sonchifolius]